MTAIVPNPQYQKGLILYEQNRHKEAAEVFKDLLSSNPQDVQALHLLAACQYHLPHEIDKAYQTVNQAVALEPDYAGHYELKSLILSGLGKNKEALTVIDQALSLDPNSCYAHGNRAYILIHLGRWAEAEKAARDALSLNADDTYAGNLLATALRMQNKLDENQHLISDLLAKDPEDAYSHSNAGWVYFQKGDIKKAYNHFREALRLNPHFEPARIGMLETFKVKSPVYGLYVKFSFFMSRQKKSVQWMIILGILIGFRLLKQLVKNSFSGELKVILGILISLVYLLFIFWSWFANGLGNFIVLTDRYARYALKKDEKLDAIFVGGAILLGVFLLLANIPFQLKQPLILGGTMIAAAIPLSITFINEKKKGRIFYGTIGTLIWILGIVTLLNSFIVQATTSVVLNFCFYGVLILVTTSTFLGAFGFLLRD